ncbi:MAG: porin [Geobacteraceae bacterium]|nr:porin [Geobacteraceae bacterium]
MKSLIIMLIGTALCFSAAPMAQAETLNELEKQIKELNEKVLALQQEQKKEQDTDSQNKTSYMKQVWQNTKIGGYGELDYISRRENGNGKGANVFDPHRFVLYVSSGLSEWLRLNAELEWEHGGVKEDVDGDELSGEVLIEQAFLDFTIAPYLNVKTGVMLVPLGGINLYHEPTNFNSTERPELDRYLIPSTWSEMGAGIYGSLGKKVDYQLLVMNGLNGEEFSAKNGIRDGRQNLNKDINRDKAIVGRVELRPLTNLYTNFSFYTANSAPKGKPTAYTTIAAFDGKYSIGDFDILGEYVHVFQDKPYVLSDEIGHTMSGYWVEGAYHFMPNAWKKGKLSEADAVIFARYSEFDTQQGSIANPAKASGKYDRNYTTFGMVFKPVQTVSVKADYTLFDDHRIMGEKPLDNDKFQLTLGFVF